MITIDERTWSQNRPELDRLPYVAEPLDAQPVGKPLDAPLGVYLSYQAAMFIETYLQANPVSEMAGFLVGYAMQSQKRPFIMIIGAIEARDVVRVDGGMQFSQETWTYLKSVWQREYADTIVLGWFHSQPGKGLALAKLNQATHERFFERPWQVSFVVDPLQNTSRFYRRTGRKLVPLEDFYLFDSSESSPPLSYHHENASSRTSEATMAAQESAAAADHEIPPPAPAHVNQNTHRWHGLGIIFLLFLVLTFTLTANRLLWHSPSIKRAAAQLSNIEAQLAEAQNEQQRLEELIQQLKVAANTEGQQQQPTRLPVEANFLDHEALPSLNSDGPIKSGVGDHVADGGNRGGDGADSNFILYVVKPGDTLWRISEIMVGSPYAYNQLAELNQLSNPDRILPGMVLRLPRTDGE